MPAEGVDTPLPPPPPLVWDSLGNLIPVNPPPISEEKPQEGKSYQIDGIENNVKTSTEDTKQEPSTPKGSDVESNAQYTETKGELNVLAESELPTTWHDVALSIAAELMGKAREEVRVKMGYSTSAVNSLCSHVETVFYLLLKIGYFKEQISREGFSSLFGASSQH